MHLVVGVTRGVEVQSSWFGPVARNRVDISGRRTAHVSVVELPPNVNSARLAVYTVPTVVACHKAMLSSQIQ